ncbi:flagellar hook-basal body complex protein [Legionella israelensis]|uniref:flagellar basal body rod protein FlgF n=1 Tax=Legionella israelensis TaxID=454 RepID=UPI00117FD61E|nr:flagellar basal body rod protein FlgF [Legionella israelensis]QDP73442.1 flagellar hook-basal body complex protein [Legionella israelensis]
MADSVLYTSTSGAKESLRKTRLMANNLANVNTIGFHADYETIASKAVVAEGMQTRISSVAGKGYTDHSPGPVYHTGRSLDVAIKGRGFFAVQNKSGQEGYTRAGNFDITAQGLLVTQTGDLVLSNDGVINIPPAAEVMIDDKGVVSTRIQGEPKTTIAEVGRLKLVNPPIESIKKGEDGLYYPIENGNVSNAQDVMLAPESLEGSNVDAVKALVSIIDMCRHFDSQAKVMGIVKENTTKANSILSLQS